MFADYPDIRLGILRKTTTNFGHYRQ